MTDAAELLLAVLRAASDPRNHKIGPSRKLYRRAADHIENLEAENGRLDATCTALDAFAKEQLGLVASLEARVAKLEADLAFADQQSAKVEALLEPHITWECASEGCGKPATIRFERGGVGSDYCRACYLRIQAIPAAREASR